MVVQAIVIMQPIPTTDENVLPIAQLNNTSCFSASILVNVTGSFSGGASLVVVASSSYFKGYLYPWVADCEVSADKPVCIVPPTTVEPNTSLYVVILGSTDNGRLSPGFAIAALSMSSTGVSQHCMCLCGHRQLLPIGLLWLALMVLMFTCMTTAALRRGHV